MNKWQHQAHAPHTVHRPILLVSFIALSTYDLSAADNVTQAQAHADLGLQLARSGKRLSHTLPTDPHG